MEKTGLLAHRKSQLGEFIISVGLDTHRILAPTKKHEMEMMYPLDGKRALVGGASRGIGLGCAKALAEAGASITVMARDETALKEALAALPSPTDQSHSILPLDTSDWMAVDRAAREDLEQRGTIEILIHNTGGPFPGPAIDADPEQFEAGFAMHILSGRPWSGRWFLE